MTSTVCKNLLLVFVAAAWGVTAVGAETPADNGRPRNVLFIAVDDLCPQLGCYGAREVLTPHIDRLASLGMVFRRAYCQLPSCSSSRYSVLTGLRPDTMRIFNNQLHIRQTIPDVITLPQQFKRNGYHTQCVGKVFHNAGSGHDYKWWADGPSWSVPDWSPPEGEYFTPEGGQRGHKGKGQVIQGPDLPDDRFYDGAVASKAVEVLRKIGDRPFFLGVGFKRPHLPFVAPKRYFDLYEGREFYMCTRRTAPKDAPVGAQYNSLELRGYVGIPKTGEIPEELARKIHGGYLACVSFVDAQIGRILAELDRLELSEKTVIVLWGDHGYHLGEQGFWGKGPHYESSLRSPLIVSVPGMKTSGTQTAALVELVDLYPTLLEICSLPTTPGLEGTSFVPVLKNQNASWKKAAFSQGPSTWVGNPSHIMFGRSIRTDRYRLTDFSRDSSKTDPFARPKVGEAVYELYEYLDPHFPDELPRFGMQFAPHPSRQGI